MPYHLRPGQPVPAEVTLIVREQIDSAVGQLSRGQETGRDEAIHEARKSVKRIRGVLRLMRPELGEIYQVENPFYRDIGQRLSQFRDAGAMIESLDAIRRKYSGDLPPGALSAIRRGLVARKKDAEKQNDIEKVLNGVAAMLRRGAWRVKKWPLSQDGFAAIEPGLKRTFRAGKKALALARKRPRPENYHDWRKRVKDHWYHVRLLEEVWDGTMPAYERRLKDLETWLGNDHNLVVLEETVKAAPDHFAKPAELARFARLIALYRKELREQALTLGALVYDQKPRQFTGKMQLMWEAGGKTT